MPPASDVIAEINAARSRGDLATMLALTHDHFIFSFNADPDQCGNGNTYIGKPALLAHLSRVSRHWQLIDQSRSDPQEYGSRVRVNIRFRLLHRKSRHILEGTKRHIWTVRDDQATSMFEIFDAEMVRAFFRMAQAGDPFEMNSN